MSRQQNIYGRYRIKIRNEQVDKNELEMINKTNYYRHLEMNLYDLHTDPSSLHGYDKADMEVPAIFWGKYRRNPNELKKREGALIKSAEYSYRHALMMRKRYFNGEPAIAKSPYYAYEYSCNVLRGPFPAGEAAIAKSAKFAFDYAVDILNGRFREAESTIAKDPMYAYWYAKDVLHGPFPAGEAAIAKSEYAANYNNFLKGLK